MEILTFLLIVKTILEIVKLVKEIKKEDSAKSSK